MRDAEKVCLPLEPTPNQRPSAFARLVVLVVALSVFGANADAPVFSWYIENGPETCYTATWICADPPPEGVTSIRICAHRVFPYVIGYQPAGSASYSANPVCDVMRTHADRTVETFKIYIQTPLIANTVGYFNGAQFMLAKSRCEGPAAGCRNRAREWCYRATDWDEVQFSCPGFYVPGGGIGLPLDDNSNPRGVPTSEDVAAQKSQEPSCNAQVADPVDVASGAYRYERVVLKIANTIPLNFTLAYSSTDPQDSPVGFGWTQRFGMKLAVLPSGSVSISWPNGRVTQYVSAGGAFTVQNGDPQDTLVKNSDGTYELTDQLLLKYRFAATGELTSEVRTVQGVPVTLTYAWSAGRLQSVSDLVSAKQVAFTYNAAGRIVTASALESGATTATANLGYDANGNLVSITDAAGKSEQFTYDTNHRLLTGINEVGNTVPTNTYDEYGRVVTQQDGISGSAPSTLAYFKAPDESRSTIVANRAAGARLYTYDANWRMKRYKDELGKDSSFGYDAAGNRTFSTDAQGRTTTYGYDARGNLTAVTDPLGQVTSMVWSVNDKLTSLTNALGQTTTYQYGPSGMLQKQIDPLGHETLYGFNSVYQAGTNLSYTVTLPGGGTLTMIRNPQNTAGSLTDATGRVINWTYDPALRRRTEAFASAPGETTLTQYDAMGRVTSTTDPLGRVTSYGYDNRGRLLTITDPKGGVTTLAYDANDRVVSRTNALGQVKSYTYDAEDRVKTITDADAKVTTFTYDGKGQLTRVATGSPAQFVDSTYTDTGSVATRTVGTTTFTFAYDALDRPVSVTNELGQVTKTSYDAAGRPSVLTDALGRKTTLAYDAAGRLTGVTDATGGAASQAFNADGNRTGLTDTKAQTTTFAYDLMGRLTGSITPDGGSVSVTYNGKGRAATFTNARNQATNYIFDATGQLTQQADPAGTINYTYDVNGNRLTAGDGAGTITRAYDALNRITSHADVFGNVIGYQYDAGGNLSQITYPGGKVVTYAYDSVNRLSTVTDWASRITRYSYDTAGRLTAITNSNNKNATFVYDNAGRLTTYNNGVNNVTYALDATGSTVQETVTNLARPASTPAFTYDNANRLASVNAQPVTHDADGNMLSVWNGTALESATYDARNRLTALGSATFTYDADNRRVAQTVGGVTTRYVVDSSGPLTQVLMETTAAGVPTAFYVYGLGLIGREDASANYVTYHFDRRGSVIGLTNSAGATTDTFKYGPYGEMVSRTGTTNQPFQYNGRDGVTTDASGLYYLRARYYSPNLKRFLQRDVLLGTPSSTPSLNRYAFVNGQPIDFVDPFGLDLESGLNTYATEFWKEWSVSRAWSNWRLDSQAGTQDWQREVAFLGGVLAVAETISFGASLYVSPSLAVAGLLKPIAKAASTALAQEGVGNCKLNRQIAETVGMAVDVATFSSSLGKLGAKLTTELPEYLGANPTAGRQVWTAIRVTTDVGKNIWKGTGLTIDAVNVIDRNVGGKK